MRLLCAEDNATLRKLLDAMLSAGGVEVDFAVNGREAVEAYEISEYDAILMDVEMPVMTGIEAAREIRQIEQGHHLGHTPILFLTGRDDADQILHAPQLGGDGLLHKPFTPQDLFQALQGAQKMSRLSGFDGDMAAHA